MYGTIVSKVCTINECTQAGCPHFIIFLQDCAPILINKWFSTVRTVHTAAQQQYTTILQFTQ